MPGQRLNITMRDAKNRPLIQGFLKNVFRMPKNSTTDRIIKLIRQGDYDAAEVEMGFWNLPEEYNF